MAVTKSKARFFEPMLLEPTKTLPEGAAWLYELKLDGYRALGIKSAGTVSLRSRNGKDFTDRYPRVSRAIANLPDETVIDGEIVALDKTGRPSFNTLQNHGSAAASVFYFVFDVLILAGKDVTGVPLARRRELLEQKILPKLADPIRYSPELEATLPDLIQSVRAQGLEGLVAKRRDSFYLPGIRSGAWQKMRLSLGQEFVIGGYTPSASNFDALVLGYYRAGKLMYAARTRNGFTPAVRAELFKRLRSLEVPECPFSNLPEPRSGRWGAGLTEAKMKNCRWLKPVLVSECEFVEWTPEGHLRHVGFVALREDKRAIEVVREA